MQAAAPLNCPHGEWNAPGSPGGRAASLPPGTSQEEAAAQWQQALVGVLSAAGAVGQGDFQGARGALAAVLLSSTAGLAPDPRAGMACSLGVAAAYRVMALAFALVAGSWAFRRAYQIALRFQHLAMIWVTHVWEKFARREGHLGGLLGGPWTFSGVLSGARGAAAAFMNMSVTLDSVLYKYARAEPPADVGARGSKASGLDPGIHMLVAEDHAMLNTGAFFLRSSGWSQDFLEKVWGSADSPWIDHPWWENAAIIWNFLRENSQKFQSEDPVSASPAEQEADDMDGIYPPEVRLSPQREFNSYHPATAQGLHDTWEPGKFAIAFNGVLSNTSPEVIRVLYGNYPCLLQRIP
ncbi:unnamed protein product, partial [Prorocentrum cordatum]